MWTLNVNVGLIFVISVVFISQTRHVMINILNELQSNQWICSATNFVKISFVYFHPETSLFRYLFSYFIQLAYFSIVLKLANSFVFHWLSSLFPSVCSYFLWLHFLVELSFSSLLYGFPKTLNKFYTFHLLYILSATNIFIFCLYLCYDFCFFNTLVLSVLVWKLFSFFFSYLSCILYLSIIQFKTLNFTVFAFLEILLLTFFTIFAIVIF